MQSNFVLARSSCSVASVISQPALSSKILITHRVILEEILLHLALFDEPFHELIRQIFFDHTVHRVFVAALEGESRH